MPCSKCKHDGLPSCFPEEDGSCFKRRSSLEEEDIKDFGFNPNIDDDPNTYGDGLNLKLKRSKYDKHSQTRIPSSKYC